MYEQLWHCPICDRSFEFAGELKRHLIDHHSDAKHEAILSETNTAKQVSPGKTNEGIRNSEIVQEKIETRTNDSTEMSEITHTKTESSPSKLPFHVNVEISSELQGYKLALPGPPLIDMEDVKNIFRDTNPYELRERFEKTPKMTPHTLEALNGLSQLYKSLPEVERFLETHPEIPKNVRKIPVYSHKALVWVEAVCQKCEKRFHYDYTLSFSATEASLFLGMAVDNTSQIESNIRHQVPNPIHCPTCGYFNNWTPEMSKERVFATWVKLMKLSFLMTLAGPMTLSVISYFIWHDVTFAPLLKVIKASLVLYALGILLSGLYAYITHRDNRYFQEFKLKEIKLTVDTGSTLFLNCFMMLIYSFIAGLVGWGIGGHSITLGIFLGSLVVVVVLPILLLRSAAYLIH